MGSVQLDHKDITSGTWRMRGGLAGEVLQVYSAAGASKVQWQGHSGKSVEPLTWLQTTFDTPAGLGSDKQVCGCPLLMRVCLSHTFVELLSCCGCCSCYSCQAA